jgi:acyl-coenzyme A thioesterase PaaI-like protein
MLLEKIKDAQEDQPNLRSSSSCFACSLENPHGLHLVFWKSASSEMTAEWIPEPEFEGYQGIIHGGIVSTVLDESMAKVVDAAGTEALTAELRVRFRQQVSSGSPLRVRGWIESRNKRVIHTEAVLTNGDGVELAHAWAVFLALKQHKNLVDAEEI